LNTAPNNYLLGDEDLLVRLEMEEYDDDLDRDRDDPEYELWR